MKTFVKNLKPFIAYWVALAVWFVPAYMLDLSDTAWITVFVVALLILNGITGYTDGVKEIRWGIALFGVQLAVCGALLLVGENMGAYALRNFGLYSSAVVQTYDPVCKFTFIKRSDVYEKGNGKYHLGQYLRSCHCGLLHCHAGDR